MAGQKWLLTGLLLTLQYGLILCTYNTTLQAELISSLFTSTYSTYVRPSDQVNVTIRFVVISLDELNIKSQTMGITGYWEVTWNDPRLVWGGSYSSIPAFAANDDVVWTPPLVVANSVSDIEVLDDDVTPILVSSTGDLEWLPFRNFKLHCDTNPTYFPFDTQKCPIAITTWSYASSLVNLIEAAGDVVSMDFYHENGEWEYVSWSSFTESVVRNGQTMVNLVVVPKFRRRPSFHVMNTIMPIIFLAILNGFIFSISVESGEKLGFILTVLLAYAVYLTLVADQIPTTSDSTSVLSILLLMTLLLSVISIIATIYVIKCYYRSDTVPITKTTRRVIKFMCYASCWRGSHRKQKVDTEDAKSNDTNGKKVDKKPELLTQKSWVRPIPEDDSEEDNLTWQEVSNIIDHFGFVWYAIAMSLTSVCCIMVMVVGYVKYDTSS